MHPQADDNPAWDPDELDPEGPGPEDLADLGGDSEDLAPCPECGTPIYENADRCPACGQHVIPGAGEKPTRESWWAVLLLLTAVALLLWWLAS